MYSNGRTINGHAFNEIIIIIIILFIIILFAIKSMIYKTHGQKQCDRTTRHTNAPTVAHE